MFLKKKSNYHETIHDGAVGMTSRHVGFLKQVKNRVIDRVLISSPLSHTQKECETNPSREENDAAVFANRIR